MNVKLPHLPAALGAIVATLSGSAIAVGATPHYCDPLAGCQTHFVKVSPGSVKAGKTITVSGAVGNGCSKKPVQVTIYSRAFRGATRREFAGVPAIFPTTNRKGKFSKRVTIKKTIKPGRYHVGGRCGGANFGSATLRVRNWTPPASKP